MLSQMEPAILGSRSGSLLFLSLTSTRVVPPRHAMRCLPPGLQTWSIVYAVRVQHESRVCEYTKDCERATTMHNG